MLKKKKKKRKTKAFFFSPLGTRIKNIYIYKVLEVYNGPMNWFKFFFHIRFPISDLKTLAKLEEGVEVTFILGSTLACCLYKRVKELFQKSPKDSTSPSLED